VRLFPAWARSVSWLVVLLCSTPFAARADGALHHFTVRLQEQKVVEPPTRRLVLPHNANVVIRWQSEQAGELHLHGYDIEIKLIPGEDVITRFETRASGRFPVTSHGFGNDTGHVHARRALLHVEVHPD